MPAAPEWQFFALCALIGAVTGVLGGLLGIGGGLIIVPALLYLFSAQAFPAAHVMHLAVGTSLAAIVFTAASSALAHHRQRAVLWHTAGLLVPGILLGGVAGAMLAGSLSGTVLRIVFGVFECAMALQVARGFSPSAQRPLPGAVGLAATGAAAGAASAVLGIGGGTFIVPFLAWCNIDMRKAVATSAACGMPVALAGGGGMILAGWHEEGLPELATGFVYWPAALAIACTSMLSAPVGAWLAHTLPLRWLRVFFAGFLLAVGLRMLAGD